MKDFIKRIFASLDNHSLGFSGRKLTALYSVIIAAWVTYSLPKDALLHALYAWQILALLCLGIITVQNIIEFKNGKPETPKE